MSGRDAVVGVLGQFWRRYLVGNSTFLWLLSHERVVGASSRGMIGKTGP